MLALDEGRGVRETARLLKVSAAKVSEVRRMSATSGSVCIRLILQLAFALSRERK